MKKGVSTGLIIAVAGAFLSGLVGAVIDHNEDFWNDHLKLFNGNVRIANRNNSELFDRVEELEKTVAELTKKEEN